MQVSSIRNMIEANPEAALRHLCRIQSYAQALKTEIQTWAYNNGQFISPDKKVKYQKRTRKFYKMDSEKARDVLKSQGINLMDVAEITLTEESIVAKLGEKAGNAVIAQLMSAGCFKEQKTTYWRLQVK